MPKPAKKASAAMKRKPSVPANAAQHPPLGLDVSNPLSHGEWQEIGRQMAMAIRSAAFVIGDWLVYGEGRGGQMTLFPDMPEADHVSRRLYREAVRLTGCDLTTLQHYAYVARRVPRSLRNADISWEHHRKVAKLRDDADKRRWLQLAAEKLLADHPLSLRLFARSIQAGRLMNADELDAERSDTGIENVHPYVNRIVAFFARLRDSGWLANAGKEKRAALKRDLQPIIDIYNEL